MDWVEDLTDILLKLVKMGYGDSLLHILHEDGLRIKDTSNKLEYPVPAVLNIRHLIVERGQIRGRRFHCDDTFPKSLQSSQLKFYPRQER